jgi:PAS domain S-box-containing protein
VPDLKTIIDTIPVMAWTAAPDGAPDFFNSHWLAYTGLSMKASVSHGWSRVLHPADRKWVLEHWQKSLSTGEAVELEVRLRRADGEYRWFLARATPLHDASGRILKWHGTSTEIEDHRRLEQALRDSVDTYREILDRVPALLFTTTAQGEVEFVNAPLLRYFDRTMEDLRAWKQADHVHPEDLPNTIALWSRAVETGKPCTIEQRLRRHDGVYRWFRFDAVPQSDSTGQIVGWYGTLTDLDDVKRQEAEIRAMQARLSAASQVSAGSQVSAAIAHEVNQPLAAVGANGDACLRWLTMQPPNVERALHSLERIHRDAMAAVEIAQRIRLLFQRAPLVKSHLDLNAVTTEVLQMLQGELRHSGILSTSQLDASLPIVQGDRVQMQQVLYNLVRNAMEAMAESDPGNKQLSISSKVVGNEAVIFVTDSGPGLRDPNIIFQPFYTTKHSGMGMGLAISKSIVEAHGGRLWATSHPGTDTTFAFALGI